MPSLSVCPQCGFSREVRDSLIGRQARCPKCKAVFVIGQNVTDLSKKIPPVLPTSVLPPPLPSHVQSPPVLKPHSASAPPKTTPNQKIQDQKIQDQKVQDQKVQTQKVQTQKVQTQAIPKQKIPDKKIPNPLEPRSGNISLCPTLQTQEELNRYRTMLLTPLQTPLQIEKMTLGYKFGLFLTALFMILLPIIYVGLIAGLSILEYKYFVWTNDIFEIRGIVDVALYLTVPATLCAIIIVLLKPLIFSLFWKDSRFEITKEREPLLFDFVQHLCTFIGAPMPRRIFVNCQVNAAAGMSYGIWGAIFGGNACDLMIGLPLVASLKTSEFAGILAHEFGHFTQSGTRRMNYIVRTFLDWFAHIYYYRDWIDKCLTFGLCLGILGIPFYVVSFFVWITRRFIWILMMLGQYVAGFMSRQMEYDADRYEIRLGGSSRFAQTATQIIKLSIANDKTVSDIQYMLHEDRLPDNYPLLIAANMKILDEKLDRWASKAIQKSKTGFCDTHPSEADRIAAANAMAEPGVLHVDAPASLFFRNFLALSREVSLDFYKNEVGLDLKPGMLKNTGAVIDQLQRENLGNEATIQFFQRAYLQSRFLPLSNVEPLQNIRYASSRLIQSRDRQAGFAVDALDAAKAYEKAETKSIQAFYFRELLRLRIKAKIPNAEFTLPKSFAEATRIAELFEAQLSVQASRLWGRDSAAAERLICARELLKQPEIQNRIENGIVLCQRIEILFPILEKIGKSQSEFDQTRRNFVAATAWMQLLPTLSQDKAGSLWRSVEDNADSVRRICKHYRTIFSDTPYPFEHAQREITLGSFFVPEWSETEWEPINYYQVFDLLLGRLLTTYSLVLGECLAIALAVEQVLGLPPLSVPPPDDENE
jgi:Zn-dependent protease with chaperone function